MKSSGELERLLSDFKKKVTETTEKSVSSALTNVEDISEILTRLQQYKTDPTARKFIEEISDLNRETSLKYNWNNAKSFLDKAEKIKNEFNSIKSKYFLLGSEYTVEAEELILTFVKNFETEYKGNNVLSSISMHHFVTENLKKVKDKSVYYNFLNAFEKAKSFSLILDNPKFFEREGLPVLDTIDNLCFSEPADDINLLITENITIKIGKDAIGKVLQVFLKYKPDEEKDIEKNNLTPEVKLYLALYEHCLGIPQIETPEFFKNHYIPDRDILNVKRNILEKIGKGDTVNAQKLYNRLQSSMLKIEYMNGEIRPGVKTIYETLVSYVSGLLKSEAVFDEDISGFRKEVIGLFKIQWKKLDFNKFGTETEGNIQEYCENNVHNKKILFNNDFILPIGTVLTNKIMDCCQNYKIEEAKKNLVFWQMLSNFEKYTNVLTRKIRESAGLGSELWTSSDIDTLETMSLRNPDVYHFYKKWNEKVNFID